MIALHGDKPWPIVATMIVNVTDIKPKAKITEYRKFDTIGQDTPQCHCH